MAVNLNKKLTVAQNAQIVDDAEFVNIVGHLLDVQVESEYIVTLYPELES